MARKTPPEETKNRTPGDKGKGSRTVNPDSDLAKKIEETHGFSAMANEKDDEK